RGDSELDHEEGERGLDARVVAGEAVDELEAEAGPVVAGVPEEHGGEDGEGERRGKVGVRAEEVAAPRGVTEDGDRAAHAEEDAGVLAEHGRAHGDAGEVPPRGAVVLERE